MGVWLISVPHHDRRGWSSSEFTIAVTEEQQHAVAIVSTNNEVQLAIEVYISERNFMRSVRDCRRAR